MSPQQTAPVRHPSPLRDSFSCNRKTRDFYPTHRPELFASASAEHLSMHNRPFSRSPRPLLLDFGPIEPSGCSSPLIPPQRVSLIDCGIQAARNYRASWLYWAAFFGASSSADATLQAVGLSHLLLRAPDA
jgi:hypothetical protein